MVLIFIVAAGAVVNAMLLHKLVIYEYDGSKTSPSTAGKRNDRLQALQFDTAPGTLDTFMVA